MVPGPVDTTIPNDPITYGVSPFNPDVPNPQGNIYLQGQEGLLHTVVVDRQPEKTWANTRWGARLQGLLFRDYTVQGWFFRTFNQQPVPLLSSTSGFTLAQNPAKISLVDDWDMIPGARGCTPQTCSFRDLFAELKAAGAKHVFGLSTQDNAYQTEMASRLHLPFPVLSDEKLALTHALKLPTMEVAGLTLIKRLALIIDRARISHVFYPVFPPDRNAGDVLAWLRENRV